MNRASVFTRETTNDCGKPSVRCVTSATPLLWWSTTKKPSALRIMSSIWGPKPELTAVMWCFQVLPEQLKAEDSLTGQYLSGRKRLPVPAKRRSGNGRKIVLQGASQNNLKDIQVVFPLGCFICVTGISGSGKSTLVLETLYRALTQRLYQSPIRRACSRKHNSSGHIDKVIHIDQSPIGRTPRSNTGTYSSVSTISANSLPGSRNHE